MVTIGKIWPEEQGVAGLIDLSNGVDVFFGASHPIKTESEALDVANKICDALNAE